MKLLVFDFGAYTLDDILQCLETNGIQYRQVNYCFANKNDDDFFVHRFTKLLAEDSYDAVFSVNYFPLVAECCHQIGMKYLSWSYDNPLDVIDIDETLGYETNYCFLFDRIQVQQFQAKGYRNVYHLPLAVDTNRLDRITLTEKEHSFYDSEIGFVGKMYDSLYPQYLSLLSDYNKGYISSLCDVQMKLYGCCVIDDMLSDDLMKSINQNILSIDPNTNFRLSREALSYAIGAEVTRKERLLLLGLLSTNHQVKLYSRENPSLLSNVQYMGSVGYLHNMPKVFKASKINLNITLKISQSGIPLRVMDILGSGGFLLSNYQPEIAENFIHEQEVVLYESIEDAYEKADFYLKHDNLRQQIAQAGYRKVKEEFNYTKQFSQLFATAGLPF